MTARPLTITNVHIVIFALGRLGGATRTVFSEDVAAESFELSADRFSWQLPKYRELRWPDKYIVKTALEDAKKAEYGALVEGSYANDTSRDGWRLTANGAKWLREHGDEIAKQFNLPSQGASSLTRRDRDRFLKQIRSNELFQLFSRGSLQSANNYQFTDMLSCSPDAPKEIVAAKLERLSSIAELSGDKAIIEFFSACRETFGVTKRSPINRAGS